MTSHEHAELARQGICAIARAQAQTTPKAGDDVEMIDLRYRQYCENKALAAVWLERLTVAAIQEAKDGWDIRDGWWWLDGTAMHPIDDRTRFPQPPPHLGWPPKRMTDMAPNRAMRPLTRRPVVVEEWVAMMERRYAAP